MPASQHQSPKSDIEISQCAAKRRIHPREDGDHLLFQPNPPSGQGKLFFAPVGSSILGVIVDVKREIQPGRARRASQRDVIAALEEEK